MGQIRNPSSTFTAAWAYKGPYYNVLTRRRGGGGGAVVSELHCRRLGLSFVIQKSNKLFQANFWLFIISKDFAKRCMIGELMLAICSSLV